MMSAGNGEGRSTNHGCRFLPKLEVPVALHLLPTPYASAGRLDRLGYFRVVLILVREGGNSGRGLETLMSCSRGASGWCRLATMF